MKKTIFKNLTLPGSAFIMVFVLTTLLALIGLIFLLTSRIDKLSTSAIEQNKQLDAAAATVIAQISQQLVMDTPGIDPNEYYDYPDQLNPWLASLEPYMNPIDGKYYWRQISDVTGYLLLNALVWDYTPPSNPVWNVPVDVPGKAVYVPDYPDIKVTDGVLDENWADADGDGIADSKWIPLDSFDPALGFVPDMTTNKGEPVYAAIRVIDNSAMLNVNTAYKFNLRGQDLERDDIDGSSQLQINLMALSVRGANTPNLDDEANLLTLRNSVPLNRYDYEEDVIWNYNNSNGSYTPFDISDELELRNRFVINNPDIDSRLEPWGGEFRNKNTSRTPFDNVDEWFETVYDITGWDPDYSYRHIATTNNLDRIIDRRGDRMVNVNRLDDIDDLNELYTSVYSGLLDAGAVEPEASAVAGRITANMKDFSDNDSNVTVYGSYYGFERPCVFISEIMHAYRYIDPDNPLAFYDPNDPNSDPNFIHHSYAIEIYKRFPAQNNDKWTLSIPKFGSIDLTDYASNEKRYTVLVFEDPCVPIQDLVVFSDTPANGETDVDPNVTLSWPCPWFDPYCDRPGFSYDVYFGLDCKSAGDCNTTCENLKDANHTSPEFVLNQPYTSFKPSDYFPIEPNITYCWRIDDVYDGNVVQTGEVWHYTVGDPQPIVFTKGIDYNDAIFDWGDILPLFRDIGSPTPMPPVDYVIVPQSIFDYNSFVGVVGIDTASYQREMSSAKFIKRLWTISEEPTLGHYSNVGWYFHYDPDPEKRGPNPSKDVPVFFGRLNNIGELGKVFSADIYSIDFNSVGLEELNVRIDVNNPIYQKLFNYLTVFDPNNYSRNNLNQTRVKGRININTAPWYVIKQLPWISKLVEYVDWNIRKIQDVNDLAKAITNYRDYTFGPFDSIGWLNNVPGIYVYGLDGKDQLWYPDLTINSRTRRDGVTDDFEERDLIFARISDLVTVRSDAFTAYILVRLGRNGPQKRVIAILDRSGVLTPADKVRIVKLYEVPDAR